MDDAVDCAKPPPRLGNNSAHPARVDHIRSRDQDLTAGGFAGLDLPYLLAGRIVRTMIAHPARPFAPLRNGRATDQHQFGLRRPGKMLGQFETDAPKTAGDQIDALAPQRPGDSRFLKRRALITLGPPIRAAIGNAAFFGAGCQFAQKLLDDSRALPAPRLGRRNIDMATSETRQFARQHPTRAEQACFGGLDQRLTGNLLDPSRDHGEIERLCPVPARKRLAEPQQAEKAIFQLSLESAGIAWQARQRRHIPQMDDATDFCSSRLQRFEQSAIVSLATGSDREIPLANLLELGARTYAIDICWLRLE